MNHVGRRDILRYGAAFAAFSALGTGAIGACRRDGTDPPDRGRVLADLSSLVFVPAYGEAALQAGALADSLALLRDAPTANALAAARTAWRSARAAWKVTDAFLFGPADDLELTGGVIDSAADAAKIEAFAVANTPLDASELVKLGANQRGFGGLDVLLFDPTKDDAATVALFAGEGGVGTRRGLYASLVASDLRAKIGAVRDAWANAPTAYGDQLATSGRGSALFPSERQGVDIVVNGLIAAAEVILALRFAKPLGIDKTPAVPAPELVESPRSDASIDDIVAALDGIEMVYLGRRGDAVGLPLADAVAERSPSTDARMRSDLENAKAAVRAIPGPLRTAVVERRDPVIAAHAAVREVKRGFATGVAGALGTSIGFTVTDGD